MAAALGAIWGCYLNLFRTECQRSEEVIASLSLGLETEIETEITVDITPGNT